MKNIIITQLLFWRYNGGTLIKAQGINHDEFLLVPVRGAEKASKPSTYTRKGEI